MLLNTRTSTGLVRLAGLILKFVAIVMVLIMAFVVSLVSAIARVWQPRQTIDNRTMDFVQNADGVWVYSA